MAKKAIQDRVPSEQPAATRNAPKAQPAVTKNRGAGPLYVRGDYSRRKGDLLGLRDVQKEFGPRKAKPSIGTVAKKYSNPAGPFAYQDVSGGFGVVPLNTVRMFPTAKAPKATDRAKVAKPKAKPAQAVSTTVDMRITPAAAKAKAPTRMAVNPRTGSTLGFTTGSRTGSTATKAGVAGKTQMSGSQRMAQNAFNKGGVAGPRKDSSGRNVSSASGKRK
jgi:hypothetical protein